MFRIRFHKKIKLYYIYSQIPIRIELNVLLDKVVVLADSCEIRCGMR